MNTIVVKNYDEMAKKGAEILYQDISSNPKITLGLATGGTQIGVYTHLRKLHENTPLDLKDITTFNLDEYIGLAPESDNSYHFYMNKYFFQPMGISKKQTYLPNGLAEDIAEECKRYEKLIVEHGGIDIQVLGVGSNGHIGFNEPKTSFHCRTHEVNLAESTIQANARYFDSIEDVPKKAISMGIETIMEAKKIILFASGSKKAKAIYQLLRTDEIDADWPVTILKTHPNVTIVVDEAAYNSDDNNQHLNLENSRTIF
ncbi:glucosamine-6-phosphate deaminase [Bacillus luteolus]|uniref:Glucosamine-6-phosphate deaminase n=1 Tax=Litchfieldia luteola TaxID=682179 RepID=A0ABR9QQ21_9BACI|nr:glucosamine-6-phosphate deaminase [Cytobacillus luteolus]MBE4910554.1 glucosamine-6-phosphate deaminase [Cytobacillus luteolus]MBP1943731.1 glucosamine-6-phosphate deaminase [Cytobacillus luteolus]